ncbi:MAG TPA: GNAT family protein [Candidatus Solibacter sp.]|nr:GNAT family protein [Candidatus Solibacter sp.]
MRASAPDEQVEGLLNDGTRIVFRPITADDKELLRVGVERLSPESRYRRFFSPIDHLSDEQLAYLTEIDYVDHFAWIGILPERGGEGVAVGRWIRDPEKPDSAEAAVTVADDYQGQGLGSALLVLLARSAIERGVRRFTLEVLGENEPMMQLMQHVGAVIDKREAGVVFMHVPLPATVEELDATPAPAILKAAAEGRIQGEVRGHGFRTRFHVR